MRKFLIILVIALSLFLVLSQVQEGDRTQEFVPPQSQAFFQVILDVSGASYAVSLAEGSTAYDLMIQASEQYGLSFSGKNFPGIGFFIEEIKGVKQDTKKGLYWIYSINGQVAQAGISNYILKSHDVITWKYEKGY